MPLLFGNILSRSIQGMTRLHIVFIFRMFPVALVPVILYLKPSKMPEKPWNFILKPLLNGLSLVGLTIMSIKQNLSVASGL